MESSAVIISALCISSALACWIFAFSVFRKIPKTGFWILASNVILLLIYSLLFLVELKDTSGWDGFGVLLIWLFVIGGQSILLLILSIVFRAVYKKQN